MDPVDTRWRKSTFSGGNGNGCVEIAHLPGGVVGLRDTKNRALTAHRYTAPAWHAFLAAVRAGDFDRSTDT